ncbi:MAG: hypothetical protein ACRESK_08740 [Gammaproteobacteria bacterium]
MKTFLKIIGGLVVIIILAIGAVFFFTGGMVKAGDEFFLALKENDLVRAYTYLSEDFKAGTNESEFRAFIEKNTISGFKESSWGERSISGGRGELTGSITTANGGVVPIKLSFVKGDNGWKIYSIEKPSAGFQEESTTVAMPTEQEQVKLVADTINIFVQSVNDKSMAKFYNHVSNLWQRESTPEKLNESFGSFYDLDADLTVLNNYSPRFDSTPAIDENGILVISGHYPTEPSRVYFEQKYIYEGLGWKLVGFNINVK